MKKKILIALGLIVILIGIGFFAIYRNLDKIVRVATERGLAFVLQVPVSVGGATVKPTEGFIEFRDIVIGNPPGYNTDRAMRFGLIRTQVDLKSIRTDEPKVNLVQVSGTEITMEAKRGGSNLQDLMNNASRLSQKEKEEPPAEKKSEKAFKIEKVIVEQTTARVAIPFLGGQTLDVPLPRVEMENLGGKNERVTPAEAIELFLAEILGSIQSAGASILPGDVLASLGDSLKALPSEVVGQLKQAPEAVTGAVQDAAKGVGDTINSVGDGIGGIFGKKKTEEKK